MPAMDTELLQLLYELFARLFGSRFLHISVTNGTVGAPLGEGLFHALGAEIVSAWSRHGVLQYFGAVRTDEPFLHISFESVNIQSHFHAMPSLLRLCTFKLAVGWGWGSFVGVVLISQLTRRGTPSPAEVAKTMDEAGVSRNVEVSRAATESPQISVNTYPTSPEKTDRSNDSHDSRTSGERSTARYPYVSMFFLLGNTIGQRWEWNNIFFFQNLSLL